MRRIPLVALSLLFLSLVTASVYAQDNEATGDSASLSIVETVPVTASLEVNLNGQIYKLAIPATLNIDAQTHLAEALLMAQEVDRVGVVLWRITEIAEYEEKFDISEYTELQPSSLDNKLVVIDSELTNLDTEPFSYYGNGGDRHAYDEMGNLYEATDQACDDINPGSTQSCLFVFDVPKTANILGLDVKVIDHKRIPYVSQE